MINGVYVSGFLYGDAHSDYTPAGVERLRFALAVGEEKVAWDCVVVDAELIARLRGRLRSGSDVFIEAQLLALPYEKHGVQVGVKRFLQVNKCDVRRDARGGVA